MWKEFFSGSYIRKNESTRDDSEKKEKKKSVYYKQVEGEKLVEQLFNPLQIILSKLREKSNAGEYALIVGDDASARLPTLALWGAMKQIYATQEIEKRIACHFIAGSRGAYRHDDLTPKWILPKQTEIDEHVRWLGEKRMDRGTGRALIITDVIETGQSVRPITEAMEKADISFDIATIWNLNKYFLRKYGSSYITGESFKLPIFAFKELAGVWSKKSMLHATRINDGSHPYDYHPKAIVEVREDIKKLSHRLAQNFLQQNALPSQITSKVA